MFTVHGMIRSVGLDSEDIFFDEYRVVSYPWFKNQ